MGFYKKHLLKKLTDKGWELISQDDNTEWWVEELWTMKSIKQNYGFTVVIGFLVDLQYDGIDKRSAVDSICACLKEPKTYTEARQGLIMYLTRGKFNVIDQLVNDIDKIRKRGYE